jgi:hypothetical protein
MYHELETGRGVSAAAVFGWHAARQQLTRNTNKTKNFLIIVIIFDKFLPEKKRIGIGVRSPDKVKKSMDGV